MGLLKNFYRYFPRLAFELTASRLLAIISNPSAFQWTHVEAALQSLAPIGENTKDIGSQLKEGPFFELLRAVILSPLPSQLLSAAPLLLSWMDLLSRYVRILDFHPEARLFSRMCGARVVIALFFYFLFSSSPTISHLFLMLCIFRIRSLPAGFVSFFPEF